MIPTDLYITNYKKNEEKYNIHIHIKAIHKVIHMEHESIHMKIV